MAIRKWGRLRTSQWHLIHSIRAGSRRVPTFDPKQTYPNNYAYREEPYEFLLTYDGYDLPTETDGSWYTGGVKKDTGARVWEGEGFPKGRVCDRCRLFIKHLEDTVEIE